MISQGDTFGWLKETWFKTEFNRALKTVDNLNADKMWSWFPSVNMNAAIVKTKYIQDIKPWVYLLEYHQTKK